MRFILEKHWKSRILKRLKVQLWRIAIEALPLDIDLASRLKIEEEDMCSLCGLELETEAHLFKNCIVAKKTCLDGT